jgi:signal transduction histidine kinase
MTDARSWHSRIVTLLQVAIVALSYIFVARIGLSLDAVGGFATLVWPASGIALASLLLGGFRLWPAVAIGAFVINYVTGAPVLAAVGIALGNTAEAVVGAYVLRRVGFSNSLERVRDVLAMIVLAAALSTLVAATAGATTLVMANIIPRAGFGEAWQSWWIGDAIGILLVAPLILVWSEWKHRQWRTRLVESVALAAVIIASGILIFATDASPENAARGREYLLFPPLIWAALRFGVRGAVTSATLATAIAIVYTAFGHGPFVKADLHASLLEVQIFVAVCATTFVLLGASIAERKRTTLALENAREAAESANRAKSGFLAVISHELRTPLNAIMGYVELLLLELDGPLTDSQRGILDRIRQSQRHLLALIEDVLGFAQVEAGRLSFALQPVVIREALAAIEPLITHEAEKKNLTLSIADTDPAIVAIADPGKLRQIILNLVTNAIKFTPQGGQVSVESKRDGNNVIVRVSDTGIGISPENLAHVFEPFFQVDQGGTRRYPGVGLGLSIVRDVVLAMNGDVAIESEVGVGTTVSIRVPAADDIAFSPGDVVFTQKREVSDSSTASTARAALRS